MNRGNYDVHNAFFEGGGPWGVIQSVLAAYIEERTGRSFHTFFDVLSGASIGGVNAIVLSLGIPAKDLAHATYACSVDLFRCTSTRLFMKQFIRSTTGISVGMDHFDHMVLYETLAPYLAPYRLKDARTGLLAGAHNMEFKKNIWFLQLDEDLFDITQMKMPAFNGETPMLDAAMAGTAIHGVFHPWLYNDHHYRDAASLIAPGQVTLELYSCLKARQKLLRSEHRARSAPIGRRDLLSLNFRTQAANDGPVTLATADDVRVHTVFLGTGDLKDLPYDKQQQYGAGLMGAVDDQNYSALHMLKQSTYQNDRIFTEYLFGPDAVTYINKSLVWKDGDKFERKHFPSLVQMDASPENQFKTFFFAGLNVEENLQNISDILRRITASQYRQGRIGAGEYGRMNAICDAMPNENPWEILDSILVTEQNAAQVYKKYRMKNQYHREHNGMVRRLVPAVS